MLLLALAAADANALEVWLASTQDCNACALYDRVAQQRGYGRALQYADRGGLTIPILAIDKGVLAEDVVAQLPAELGPKNPGWAVQLLVLVMDVDRVLMAGNIAESADNLALRQPQEVMFPADKPTEGDPALRASNVYSPFFIENWNLEYFVDVALGKRPHRAPARLVDLAAPEPAKLGARNVVLWGSAATPLANALFIPTRLGEIRAQLEGMSLGAPRFVTLYGHGPGVVGNDTSALIEGQTQFLRAPLKADYAADGAGLNAVLTGVRETAGARTLLVQVGHSGPTGAPLWGHGLTLTPADLAPLAAAPAGELVVVSGACNGGQFAKSAQCGFFAAHPDVRASGCQLSPLAIAASDDYLRLFFRSASGTTEVAAPAGSTRTTRVPQRARTRGGAPLPTLYDAHWYASTRLEDAQLSYTTTDALIDDFFAANPSGLPPSMTVAEIQAAAAAPGRPRAEADAALALTQGLAPDLAIPLSGYVEANHEADEKLATMTEMTSAERNAIAALPYKLVLPLLARRFAYAQLNVANATFARAAACEQRTLPQALGADRAR
jgi:hypothetical protein